MIDAAIDQLDGAVEALERPVEIADDGLELGARVGGVSPLQRGSESARDRLLSKRLL